MFIVGISLGGLLTIAEVFVPTITLPTSVTYLSRHCSVPLAQQGLPEELSQAAYRIWSQNYHCTHTHRSRHCIWILTRSKQDDAAVLEWTIAVGFTAYLVTFVCDFWDSRGRTCGAAMSAG